MFFYIFSVNFVAFIIFAFISLKFLKSYFPLSISSNRSALPHDPIIRGVGIFFPICFIISNYLLTNSLELPLSNYLLIFISTLIGFYDDCKNLSYKKKLTALIILFILVISIDNNNLLFGELNYIFSVFISLIFFIFFILFFNQIDGINGLSSGTFCVFFSSLIFLKFNEMVLVESFIIILSIAFSYYIFNILKFNFFQGDSGAYFLGAVSYIIIQKNEDLLFVSLAFLFPILGDIIWTTLMRVFFKYNLSQPHKTHLYQKSVSKIKAHFPVSFCHILIQFFCFFIIYYFEIYKLNLFLQLISLILFGLFFSTLYIYTSYLFNKTK